MTNIYAEHARKVLELGNVWPIQDLSGATTLRWGWHNVEFRYSHVTISLGTKPLNKKNLSELFDHVSFCGNKRMAEIDGLESSCVLKFVSGIAWEI